MEMRQPFAIATSHATVSIATAGDSISRAIGASSAFQDDYNTSNLELQFALFRQFSPVLLAAPPPDHEPCHVAANFRFLLHIKWH
jgi:hypothetical protein